ncbi:MAG: hypothetical protein FJZ98_08740 [Chloroflexi bacterium]|nr:hypothetical protein [Chloroflexota bacterium]
MRKNFRHTPSLLLLVLLMIVRCGKASTPPSPPVSVTPPLPVASAAPRGNRILSIDITEAIDGNFDAAFDAAKSVGIQATSLSVFWDEIEIAPGVFNPDPNWLEIANLYYSEQDIWVSLSIAVIDTNNLRLPSDLTDKPFDSPVVITRFKALLDYIIGQIPDLTLTSLAIGNEIDSFLGDDTEAWGAFETFFIAAVNHSHTLLPGIPVGSKTTFDGITGSPAPYIRSLNRYSDVVLMTYYPLRPDFSVRPPSTVQVDFQTITKAFSSKSIYLLEAGYPSGEVNHSSCEQQAEFVHELFLAWDAHADQIGLISYTWLTDISPETVKQYADYYNLNDPGFLSYLATLGLRTSDGQDKPAFQQWKIEAKVRGW